MMSIFNLFSSEEEEDEEEEFCDGQKHHEFTVKEETEVIAVERHYDTQEEAEVIIVKTIPTLVVCGVCGETIENENPHRSNSYIAHSDYEEEAEKIIVNDLSDAKRKDATDDYFW